MKAAPGRPQETRKHFLGSCNMANYSITSPATVGMLVQAETAREALKKWCEFLPTWIDEGEDYRNVDGVLVWPANLDNLNGRIEVRNCDAEKDMLVLKPSDDIKTDLQAALFQFIDESTHPNSKIPRELVPLADALLKPLREHLLRSRKRDG